MLGRSIVASSGFYHEPKLMEKGFVGTNGFRRGDLVFRREGL